MIGKTFVTERLSALVASVLLLFCSNFVSWAMQLPVVIDSSKNYSSAHASSASHSANKNKHSSYSGKMDQKSIREVCEAVSSWQIAHFDKVPLGQKCFIADYQVHWSSGVLYAGMSRWASYSSDERIFDFLKGIGDANGWGLYSARTPYHADDICVGQMYVDVYNRYHDSKMLEATFDRALYVASNPSHAALSKRDKAGKHDRWSWCDALFMAPPVYASIYRITGNETFKNYLDSEFRECVDSLYDRNVHLFFRDCIRREVREPNGKGEYWARGNAWVLAGIALTLDNLPADYDGREYFENIFKEMAAAVVKCQGKDGCWRPSMMDPDHFPTPETSSTSLFCFSLAYGINHGILAEKEYLPIVKKAWKALCSHVHSDGKLGFAQPIGAFPQSGITENDTAVYAVGGFLMAAAEISRFLDKEYVGSLKNKTLSQTSNDLTLGCEALDRDYADYHKYKEYLEPLGIRRLRLQGGWAKTEKVKGVYDFAWLDSIIDDAVGRGFIPWVELSYGNPIYEGGGTPYLAGGWPVSQEAKDAWDRWVRTVAERYKGKVCEWEIWNEPDINVEQFKDYRSFVDLTVRTAKILRAVDSDAKISAFAWAYADPIVFDKCLKALADAGALDLIDCVTYHFYRYRPEDMYPEVEKLQEVLARYSDRIKMRQGETGAPSVGRLGGALADYDWTEVSQSKWDLRRMMSDKGRGIQTTVFTVSDFYYSKYDHITLPNRKGLLLTDPHHNVLKAKEAYYAVRNVATLWDEADKTFESCTETENADDRIVVCPLLSRSHSLYCFKDSETDLPSFSLWFDDEIPGNSEKFEYEDIIVTYSGTDVKPMKNPVAIDVRTGKIYKLRTEKCGVSSVILKAVPVYDSPVMVMDMSLIRIQ